MPRRKLPGPRAIRRKAAFLAAPLLLCLVCAGAQAVTLSADRQALALGFFAGADRVAELDGTPPAAAVFRGQALLGYVFLTDEVVPIPAYSGQPVSVLVGIDVAGTITGPARKSRVDAAPTMANRTSW